MIEEVDGSERPIRSELRSAVESKYSVRVNNQSNSSWRYFIYQQPPRNSDLTLAWLVSSLVIRPEQSYTFTWTTNYSLVWSESGIIGTGITVTASGQKDCDPQAKNFVTFKYEDESAYLTDPVQRGDKGNIYIHTEGTVPDGRFAVGIGMSGKPTHAIMARPNITSIFTPGHVTKYYVAAADRVEEGEVINISIIEPLVQGAEGYMEMNDVSEPCELVFPDNVTNLTVTFQKNNLWRIELP